MVSLLMFKKLLKLNSSRYKVIVIGDPDQLASVGEFRNCTLAGRYLGHAKPGTPRHLNRFIRKYPNLTTHAEKNGEKTATSTENSGQMIILKLLIQIS